MLKRNKGFLLTAVLLAAVTAAAGKLIEEATGAKVETKDDTVTITTKDGQVQLGGDSGKLPEDFPLPAYPGAKVISSATTTEQGVKHFIVSLTSEKAAKELTAYYEDALQKKGMTLEKTDISDDTSTTVLLSGKADKADAAVQIVDGESIGEKGFVINLFYNQKQ